MSLAHERVLELQSQTDLLERIQLLTRFGSNLITVSGETGAGKTWIAQHYLEVWAEDKNQSLLLCYPNQDDRQHRSTILTQIHSQATINPDESLVSNLTAILGEEECNCNIVIVVDDAHRLSESLISELWTLVLEAQNKAQWSINVVFFTLPRVLDKLLSRLGHGQENKPIDLEIEALSQEDADRFFEYLVVRYVDDNVERKVRNAYSRVKKIPGEIMALGEQKVEKRIIIRSIVGSPVKIAIIVVLMVILVGGGYWWMLSSNRTPDFLHAITSEVTQTVIPTLSDVSQKHLVDTVAKNSASTKNNEGTTSPHSDTAGTSATDSAHETGSDGTSRGEMSKGLTDDSNALPPDVVSQTTNVGEDDQGRRVVVTSEVVDALLAGKEDNVGTAPIREAVKAMTPPPQNVVSDDVTLTGTEGKTAGDPSQDSTAKKTPMIRVHSPESADMSSHYFTFARDELMAMSERSYTLQLAAFNSLREVDDFIQRYKMQGKVNVYPTLRGDVKWFMITYKNYPTIQMARDAVVTLPSSIQALGPWAKSIRQVHREINRAK